jgi:hypothetical protein
MLTRRSLPRTEYPLVRVHYEDVPNPGSTGAMPCGRSSVGRSCSDRPAGFVRVRSTNPELGRQRARSKNPDLGRERLAACGWRTDLRQQLIELIGGRRRRRLERRGRCVAQVQVANHGRRTAELGLEADDFVAVADAAGLLELSTERLVMREWSHRGLHD